MALAVSIAYSVSLCACMLIALHVCRFIIDGVITMPIALYGFFMFPDVPTTTKAFYLSDEVSGRYRSRQSTMDIN